MTCLGRLAGAGLVALAAMAAAASGLDLRLARDRQDGVALAAAAAELDRAVQRSPADPTTQFRLAEARSYQAEVLLELGDRAGARQAAEEGIRAAERAVALQPNSSENHRILGTLCGQVIPANLLLALKYGRCASDSIRKALELDPKSAQAYLSRGVGNYYLPPAFGGGPELAAQDFQKAAQLNPKLAEAHLWLGITLRKIGKNAEARAAIKRSLELDPDRAWAKQQLEKTPPK
ncbi:MAG: tetratricopeptide repeat protein [Bryobacteraceae bacterium]